MRTLNTARTVHEVSSQASMYIPLTIPSTPLPPYIELDRTSQWHTSALLSMAWESATLPSRFRPDHGKRGPMDDMEAALNVNGNQHIASLQCSLLDPSQANGNNTALSRASNDQRMPGPNTSNWDWGEDNAQEANARYDVDLSSSKTHDKHDHVFGRVEVCRGNAGQGNEIDGDDDGQSRKRRRTAGAPIVQKSVICISIVISHSAMQLCMQAGTTT